MPPMAKELRIKEADGGFIIHDDSDYGAKPKVAKTLAAVIKAVKETFASDDASDTATEED